MKLFSIEHLLKGIIIFITVTFIISCASNKLQTSNTYNQSAKNENDTLNIAHTFYLIGDAGNALNNLSTKALHSLSNKLKSANKNATVLFLGDNIYPLGMPKPNQKLRDSAEYKLQAQINAVSNFKGKTIFIPGNHDWYSKGNEGLKEQQNFVESKLGKKSFSPKNGCPIESIDISDDITLITVDSQWYITNWDKFPTINDNCEINTRNLFLESFRSEIKKARGKITIVALHHPMYTNGPHGGRYPFNSHFKPFPILGTLKNLLRKTTGISNADIQNTHYNDLKKNLIAAAQQNENVIFVSGHEHNLQYIVKDNLHQIVSGSGSKSQPVKNAEGGIYAHSANGYAILDVYKNGHTKVKFINAVDEKIDFQTTIFDPQDAKINNNYPLKFPDSIQASIYTKNETTKGKFYKFLWGDRYRKYYSAPIKAKVVTLDTLMGGLTPIRKGGGTQSRTLRLKAKDGKQYVMRAMKKNASQYIQASMFKNQYVQKQFESTASEDLVKDVFTGAYPYAPFVVGTLSDAVEIHKLNSKLYYIPKHEALGNFNTEFGDELYLFEEHPADGNLTLAEPNFTGNICSTMDVFSKIHKNEKASVNEIKYIRARLFDMLIGDWDRHQDQWRWLEFKKDNQTIFEPLPRDRDQAFSIMSSGFVLGTAVKIIPMAKLLKSYSNDLKDVQGFSTEPFPIDKTFIKHLNREDWVEQATYIQAAITNEVIDKAFSNIPSSLNDTTIKKIKNTLKARKDNLKIIANRYFDLISKYAVVLGTNQKDDFLIEINKNKEVKVSITTGEKSYFEAVYSPNVTKEIWIYGLDENDVFTVKGKTNKIKIRLIGGQNNDKYIIDEDKNCVIYDYKSKKNDVEEVKNGTIKLSDKYDINTYDYKKIKKNQNQLIPVLGLNPDDGFKIGFNNIFTSYGFERNPFTSQHQLKTAFYFATNGYEINYKFEKANIFKSINLVLHAAMQSPNFTFNFFGYGNETLNKDDDFGLNYNRIKLRSLTFNPQLKWRDNSGSSLSFGTMYENIEINKTANRYIENNLEVPAYIFEEVQFFGTSFSFNFENYDNKAYPTMGMKTSIEIGYKLNLDNNQRHYQYIIPEISFNHKLDSSGKLVIATKLKSHINFGTNFEIYQSASIGGIDGLRGYRNQRFTGNQSFYQNTDLRYSFSSMKTKLIPIRLGMYTGFDYGRVWFKQENSNKWHNSYGGGFFVNGAELLNVNLGVFGSHEGLRVAFGLGFSF